MKMQKIAILQASNSRLFNNISHRKETASYEQNMPTAYRYRGRGQIVPAGCIQLMRFSCCKNGCPPFLDRQARLVIK